MDTDEEDAPGINELAAFIVASVKNAVSDVVFDANDAVARAGRAGRLDVDGLVDEGALLRIAKEQIQDALVPIAQAVVDRAREDLNRGLNA
jgi:hypothetical protein